MASAIPLPLRAVGCLRTREIAAAFLVSEATMAQRISRAKAKAKVKASDKPFVLPSTEEQAGRPDRRLMARWSRSRSRTARSGIGRSSPGGWGVALITDAMRQGAVGDYQVQAAIAAVHDQAPLYEETNWPEIAALYSLLEQMTDNLSAILAKSRCHLRTQVPMARRPGADPPRD